MTDTQWYLLRSKPRQEQIAELHLRQLGVETFCPRVKVANLPRNKSLREGEVLFPNYLFIRADMTTHYRKITYTHGVLNVVKFGGMPAVVEEDIINEIRQRIRNGIVTLSRTTYPHAGNRDSLRPGQLVHITQGPLCGLRAIFEQELNGAQRVALLMKTMAFQGRVVIDRSCVGLP